MGKLRKGWTDWHQILYTSADSSGNEHRPKTICSSRSQDGILGGFNGSNIQTSGKGDKTAGPIGTKLCADNYADDPGNGQGLKKLAP